MTLAAMSHAFVIVGFTIIWINFDGLIIIGDCPAIFSQTREHHTTINVRVRIMRIELNRACEIFDSGSIFAKAEKIEAPKQVSIRISRIQGSGGFILSY